MQNHMAYHMQWDGWFWGPSSAKIPIFGTEQQLDHGAKLHIHILEQVWLPWDRNKIGHSKITQRVSTVYFIFDCNLKTNYQILIIFMMNIPDTTCYQMTI